MQDVITWGAVVAACGSIVALVSFWINFGKAQGEMAEQIKGTTAVANRADQRSEALTLRLAELQVTFANQYVTQYDLNASEARVTAAVGKVESKLEKSFEGINDRLDQIIETRVIK